MSSIKNNNHNIGSSEHIWSDHTFLQRQIIYIVTIANPRMNKIVTKYKNFSIQSP